MSYLETTQSKLISFNNDTVLPGWRSKATKLPKKLHKKLPIYFVYGNSWLFCTLGWTFVYTTYTSLIKQRLKKNVKNSKLKIGSTFQAVKLSLLGFEVKQKFKKFFSLRPILANIWLKRKNKYSARKFLTIIKYNKLKIFISLRLIKKNDFRTRKVIASVRRLAIGNKAASKDMTQRL